MSTTTVLSRFGAILEKLNEKAKIIDQNNATLKAHRRFKDNALFSPHLFTTQSDKFEHYVIEIYRKINELKRLLLKNQNELTVTLLEQIEQQIASLTIAINANTTLHSDSQYRINKRNTFFEAQKRNLTLKKTIKKLIQPSQNNYQKLSEHHEFERRLATMIAEREFKRAKCGVKQSQILTNEILKLHQRLGRCRQAISLIERDIERAEKKS